MNQLDLRNRHAIITGGAAGIGLAIAERMKASGATITLWDRDAKALATAQAQINAGTRAAVVDVTREDQLAAAAKAAVDAAGKIDVLVCSAGITGPNATVVDYRLADWQQVIDINLTGVFLCNKVVAPYMVAANYGRIVNVASIAGKEGNPNASAYSASKAGVIALTKSLGKELAKTDVRVNCVTPAAVRTGMFSQMTQAHIDFMLSKIPLSRFGMVEEIAALVCWLATEDCSFSTGAVFDLSGGRATY
jgi:3-oxoacyl-[acyl-carrier protein] reductase